MGKRGFLEIGIVLLGILFLTWTIVALPVLIGLFYVEPSEIVQVPEQYALIQIVGHVVTGIIGLLFVLFPSTIADVLCRRLSTEESSSNIAASDLLVIGLVVCGVYFTIDAIPGMIRELRGILNSPSTVTLFSISASLAQLIIGLFLAFRPNVVVGWLSVNKSFKRDA